MSAKGFETHFPMEKLSVRGYAEALRHYREIMRIRRSLAKAMLRERPDLFIGVDSSDFNLGLERELKDAGIPAIHYVSPAVWLLGRWPRTASGRRCTTCISSARWSRARRASSSSARSTRTSAPTCP